VLPSGLGQIELWPVRVEYNSSNSKRQGIQDPEISLVNGQVSLETLRVLDGSEDGADLEYSYELSGDAEPLGNRTYHNPNAGNRKSPTEGMPSAFSEGVWVSSAETDYVHDEEGAEDEEGY
jgi:hypothetical protein